jgi:hypothetical protein
MERILKHHNLISFCIGLLFLLVLQAFANPVPVFRFLVPIFLLYAGAVTLYNRWYLQQTQKYNFWLLIRPLLLLVAGFGIFLVIPTAGFRGLFLITTVGLITLCEVVVGSSAENITLNETLIIAFGLFLSLAAFYQYAPTYGIYCVVSVFIAAALLARSFYESVPETQFVKQLGALILALFCAEVFWALNFLPLHFSALAIILFDIFYFCLILNYYHLFHILSIKKIQFHLLLILFCSAVVLISTPWTVIQ